MSGARAAVCEEGSTGSYLAEWLDHMRGRVRPKTFEGYEGVIRLYAVPNLGAIPLLELRPLDLQRLYGRLLSPERGLSGGTVLNLHLVLTQALGQAVAWGLISSSPASGAQPPRPRRAEPVVVDASLAARLLRAAEGTRFELAVALAISTGMRRGEILGLRWCDLGEDQVRARWPVPSGASTAPPREPWPGPAESRAGGAQAPSPSHLHVSSSL